LGVKLKKKDGTAFMQPDLGLFSIETTSGESAKGLFSGEGAALDMLCKEDGYIAVEAVGDAEALKGLKARLIVEFV